MHFQSYAYDKNHWLLEPDLPHILAHYGQDLTSYQKELTAFGVLAGGRAYQLASSCPPHP